MIHDFITNKENERRDTLDPNVVRILRNLFPNATGMRREKDLQKQRVGIDVHILQWKPVTLDFKFRETVYEDFLLEYSNDAHDGTSLPGWVNDPTKEVDYIAYIYKPIWLCYLLPVLPLQKIWMQHGERWKQIYPTRFTENTSWDTHWCAVPRQIILDLIPCRRGDIATADIWPICAQCGGGPGTNPPTDAPTIVAADGLLHPECLDYRRRYVDR